MCVKAGSNIKRRIPANPITPHGAYYLLNGKKPNMAYRSYDDEAPCTDHPGFGWNVWVKLHNQACMNLPVERARPAEFGVTHPLAAGGPVFGVVTHVPSRNSKRWATPSPK